MDTSLVEAESMFYAMYAQEAVRAVPWQQIIAIIAQILAGCIPPAKIAQRLKNNPIMASEYMGILLYRAFMLTGNWSESLEIVKGVKNIISSSDEGKLTQMMTAAKAAYPVAA